MKQETIINLSKEYQKKLQAVKKAMEASDAKINALRMERRDMLKNSASAEDIAANKAAIDAECEKYGKLAEKERVLNLAVRINHDNNRRACFDEVIPAAYEVFRKYTGKKYGPKTAEKIREELREKCGAYISIFKEYGRNNISICVLGKDGRRAHDFSYNELALWEARENNGILPVVDEDNRINAENLKKCTLLSCNEYINDPLKAAEKIIETAAKVNAAAAAYNAITSELAAMLPSNTNFRREYPSEHVTF